MKLKTLAKKALKAVLPYGCIVLWRRFKAMNGLARDKATAPITMNYNDGPLPALSETVSFVVVTSGRYLDRLIDLLKTVSAIADETVVILDNPEQSVYKKIEAFADTVVMLPGKGCFEAYSKDIFRYCTKSWILRLDDDETLSPNCTRDVLHELISDRAVFAYWIPRKWYVDANSFISSKPWYPSYQLRLFRNQFSCVTLPPFIHSPMEVTGNTKKIDFIYLKHWDLMWNSRSEREKKVKCYESLLPGNKEGIAYLWEDEKVEITND